MQLLEGKKHDGQPRYSNKPPFRHKSGHIYNHLGKLREFCTETGKDFLELGNYLD